MQEWKNIGHILIEAEILTARTVARVLAISKEHNKRFGWVLERLGLVTGDELAAALAKQYDLKLVSNICDHNYPREMFKHVTCELAIQNLMFPLRLEHDTLLMAVADPTNTKIIDNLASNSGLRIILCIATRDEIYAAICRHYLNSKPHTSSKETVLIIEDEMTAQVFAKEFLVKANYNVLVANDGMEGFNMMITHKPHVVLTDKVMPKIDGFTFLKSICAIPELQAIPVILMSDKLSSEEEMRVFDLGFFDYVPKPINMITLVSRVKRALKFNNRKLGIF